MQRRLIDSRPNWTKLFSQFNWRKDSIFCGGNASFWVETLEHVFTYATTCGRRAMAILMVKEHEEFNNSAWLVFAGHLEEVGRLHEAADVYEYLKMYDKARELRTGGLTIKKMEIMVDLNKLLAQIRDGGMVAVYKCPNCGGKLKVGKDATLEKFRRCEYCSHEIQTADFADFLKDVLS
jgi:DNA-directed RNA polymerase subunit RPC12/RpoP